MLSRLLFCRRDTYILQCLLQYISAEEICFFLNPAHTFDAMSRGKSEVSADFDCWSSQMIFLEFPEKELEYDIARECQAMTKTE